MGVRSRDVDILCRNSDRLEHHSLCRISYVSRNEAGIDDRKTDELVVLPQHDGAAMNLLVGFIDEGGAHRAGSADRIVFRQRSDGSHIGPSFQVCVCGGR